VSDTTVRSHVDNIDLLATFDAETLIRHAEDVTPNGGILYDISLAQTEIDKVDTIEPSVVERIKSRLKGQGLGGDVNGVLEEAKRSGIRTFPITYDEIIRKTGQELGELSL
jgi:2-oxoglutarate ferredoxin oxidoreductase subunit alpha